MSTIFDQKLPEIMLWYDPAEDAPRERKRFAWQVSRPVIDEDIYMEYEDWRYA